MLLFVVSQQVSDRAIIIIILQGHIQTTIKLIKSCSTLLVPVTLFSALPYSSLVPHNLLAKGGFKLPVSVVF